MSGPAVPVKPRQMSGSLEPKRKARHGKSGARAHGGARLHSHDPRSRVTYDGVVFRACVKSDSLSGHLSPILAVRVVGTAHGVVRQQTSSTFAWLASEKHK